MDNERLGRVTLKIVKADLMDQGSLEREQLVTECLRECTVLLSEICQKLDELNEKHMIAEGPKKQNSHDD